MIREFSRSTDTCLILGQGAHRVLCLNGWFGHAGDWGPWTDSLDTKGFTYAFMDYRGYGRRRGSGGDYSMAEIAADALAAADELGWEDFSLIGHSMGGMAVQQVLAETPERVRALVGVCPVPASGVPFDEAGWGLFSSAAQDASARRAIIDLTTGNRLTGTWLDAMVQSSLAHSDREAFAAYLEAWARTSLAERIQGLDLPVLVIAGEHDPALGMDTCRATWLQHYPQATLQCMGNAGHYPMNETPVALASAIEAFLREH